MKRLAVDTLWLTRTTLLLYIPIGLVSVPIAMTNIEISTRELVFVSLVVTGAMTIMMLLAMMLSRIPFRGNLRLVLFLLVVLVMGTLRGTLLFHLLEWLQIESQVTLLSRIIASAASVVLWLTLISLASSALEENRRQYQLRFASRALKSAKRAELPPDELAKKIDALSNIQALQASLSKIADTARQEQVSEGNLLLSASQLRDEIENSLRPLSHRIWFNETLSQPQFRLVGLLQQALKTPEFRPVLTGLITMIWFIAGAGAFGPLIPVLLGAGFAGVLVTIFSAIAKRLSRGKTLKEIQSLFIFLFIGSATHACAEILVNQITGESWVEDQLSSFIWMALTLFGAMLAISALQVVSNDLKLLDQMLDEAVLYLDGDVRHRFAGYLHNSLQSELSALAIRLELASKESPESTDEVISRLEEISRLSIGTDFSNRDLNPEQKLSRVISGWSGIIEVEIDLCDELWKHQERLALFVEIVQEATANAVRHARAEWLKIGAKAADGKIRVEILNPQNDAKSRKASVGMAWLKNVATDVKSEITLQGEHLISFILE